MPRVLAVASGGGHWVQLRRLGPAFDGCAVTWVTTRADYRAEVGGAPFHVVRDASRADPIGLAVLLLQLAWPGLLALWLGKLCGARTVWLDSIANADELSLSGRRAARHADLWLTQWPHLAVPGGPRYVGQVFGQERAP
jgi:hypothetical protein